MKEEIREIEAANMPSPEPVTWAGKGPTRPGFCFATESGRILWAFPGSGSVPNLSPVIGSGEAINGVAFTSKLMAVSNRREVVILNLAALGEGYTHEGGAHGLIASEAGRIIAPMGSEGLLVIQPLEDGRHARMVLKADGADPYFYQTIQLGPPHRGAELFASACRTDGLVLTPIGPGSSYGNMNLMNKENSLQQPEADVVSLCSLEGPDCPYALALLAIDGTIYFSPDARAGSFTGMSLVGLKGTPYSIHSAQGHLFILTSEKIYAMQDLADRMIRNPEDSTEFVIRSVNLDVDAVDCSLVYGEYLLIVQEDYVSVTGVSKLSEMFRNITPVTAEIGGTARGYSTFSPNFSNSGFRPSQFPVSDPNPQLLQFTSSSKDDMIAFS